jgi:hypothetical protein
MSDRLMGKSKPTPMERSMVRIVRSVSGGAAGPTTISAI